MRAAGHGAWAGLFNTHFYVGFEQALYATL